MGIYLSFPFNNNRGEKSIAGNNNTVTYTPNDENERVSAGGNNGVGGKSSAGGNNGAGETII